MFSNLLYDALFCIAIEIVFAVGLIFSDLSHSLYMGAWLAIKLTKRVLAGERLKFFRFDFFESWIVACIIWITLDHSAMIPRVLVLGCPIAMLVSAVIKHKRSADGQSRDI